MVSPEQEQRTLEAVAIGPKAYYSLRDRIDRYVLYGILAATVLAFVWIYVVKGVAYDAKKYSQAVCPLIFNLSKAPLPDKPQQYSLTTVAGLRATYQTANCVEVTGKLPAPDPRLLPYIALFN